MNAKQPNTLPTLEAESQLKGSLALRLVFGAPLGFTRLVALELHQASGSSSCLLRIHRRLMTRSVLCLSGSDATKVHNFRNSKKPLVASSGIDVLRTQTLLLPHHNAFTSNWRHITIGKSVQNASL